MLHTTEPSANPAKIGFFSKVFSHKKLAATIPPKDWQNFIDCLRSKEYKSLRIDLKYRITVDNKSWVVFGSRINREQRILFTQVKNDIIILDYLAVHDEYETSNAMNAAWFKDTVQKRLFTANTVLVADLMDPASESDLNLADCADISDQPIPYWNDRRSFIIHLDQTQKQATTISAQFLILTGAPGVGKTVVVRTMLWEELEKFACFQPLPEPVHLIYIAKSGRLARIEKELFSKQAISESTNVQLHHFSDSDLYPQGKTHSHEEIERWVTRTLNIDNTLKNTKNNYPSLHTGLSRLQIIQELQLIYVLRKIDPDNFEKSYCTDFSRKKIFSNPKDLIDLFLVFCDHFFNAPSSLPYVEGFHPANPLGNIRSSLTTLDEGQNSTLPEIWALSSRSDRFVIAGDPKQNQSWQGIDNIDLFEAIARKFNIYQSQDIERLPLYRNYRCGREILQTINQLLRLRAATIEGVTYKGEPPQLHIPNETEIHNGQVRFYADITSEAFNTCLQQLPSNSVEWAVITPQAHVDEAKLFFQNRGINALILPLTATPGSEFAGIVLYKCMDRAVLKQCPSFALKNMKQAFAENFTASTARSSSLPQFESFIRWVAAYFTALSRGQQLAIVIEPPATNKIEATVMNIVFPQNSHIHDHTRSFPLQFATESSLEDKLSLVRGVLLNGETALAKDWFNQLLITELEIGFDEWSVEILGQRKDDSVDDSVIDSNAHTNAKIPLVSNDSSRSKILKEPASSKKPHSLNQDFQICSQLLSKAIMLNTQQFHAKTRKITLNSAQIYSLFFDDYFVLESGNMVIAQNSSSAQYSLFAVFFVYSTVKNIGILNRALSSLCSTPSIQTELLKQSFFEQFVLEKGRAFIQSHVSSFFTPNLSISVSDALLWATVATKSSGALFLKELIRESIANEHHLRTMLTKWVGKTLNLSDRKQSLFYAWKTSRDTPGWNELCKLYKNRTQLDLDTLFREPIFTQVATGNHALSPNPSSVSAASSTASLNSTCISEMTSTSAPSGPSLTSTPTAIAETTDANAALLDAFKRLMSSRKLDLAQQSTQEINRLCYSRNIDDQHALILYRDSAGQTPLMLALAQQWYRAVYFMLLNLSKKWTWQLVNINELGLDNFLRDSIAALAILKKSLAEADKKALALIIKNAFLMGFWSTSCSNKTLAIDNLAHALVALEVPAALELLESLKKSKQISPDILNKISTSSEMGLVRRILRQQIEMNQDFSEIVVWLLENNMCDADLAAPSYNGMHSAIELCMQAQVSLQIIFSIILSLSSTDKLLNNLRESSLYTIEQTPIGLILPYVCNALENLVFSYSNMESKKHSYFSDLQFSLYLEEESKKLYMFINLITEVTPDNIFQEFWSSAILSHILDRIVQVTVENKNSIYQELSSEVPFLRPIFLRAQKLNLPVLKIKKDLLISWMENSISDALIESLCDISTLDGLTKSETIYGSPLIAAAHLKQESIISTLLFHLSRCMNIEEYNKHLHMQNPHFGSFFSITILHHQNASILKAMLDADLLDILAIAPGQTIPVYAQIMLTNHSECCRLIIEHMKKKQLTSKLKERLPGLPGIEKALIFHTLSLKQMRSSCALLSADDIVLEKSEDSDRTILDYATELSQSDSSVIKILLKKSNNPLLLSQGQQSPEPDSKVNLKRR